MFPQDQARRQRKYMYHTANTPTLHYQLIENIIQRWSPSMGEQCRPPPLSMKS